MDIDWVYVSGHRDYRTQGEDQVKPCLPEGTCDGPRLSRVFQAGNVEKESGESVI